MQSKYNYQLQAKDNEITRLKAVIERQSGEITQLRAGYLINTADCEMKVLDARYEQQNKIVGRVTGSADNYQIEQLENKYKDLLKRHEISHRQLVEMTQLVDQLKQENADLRLENIDLRKESAQQRSGLAQGGSMARE